ncbi:Nif-specific regulatory protein [Desulfosalsimonas propionicica]|uniref:Nif-specific regulatory protein n=1 Tax=Desulfosalsimonas propionicica TaxID=332175 RepID=A0A7W0C6L7_9BACT|nr:sigma 54-interacting transcriptional regulator [Desulfosalsimonas propionicica]MBA2880121.1 Nif-specific regulatory protein [Desulfosalsimonas propionicica]
MNTTKSKKSAEEGRDKGMENGVWMANDLDRLLEMILEAGARMMRARASSLLLLEKKTGRLNFQVATGAKKEDIKQFSLRMGEGIAGHVASTGEPLLIPDVSRDRRWYRYISDQIGFKTRSIACVPLKVGSRVIGVVEFINKGEKGRFQESDLELINVFAELAAIAIENARKFKLVELENRDLKQDLHLSHEIVGKSHAIRQVVSDALQVADSMASTLILGESGTGKELLARLIHQASPRKDRPLVALNCAAMPETLLEAELFGYEKGAFTGATGTKIGKFELADEGTIFLDEIAEMSPAMQAKLLRVLQDGIFYRLGGNTPIAVDIRVIAATNRKIGKEVQSGNFREDLYYRLNVVELQMPPLRERKSDIPLLAAHFVEWFRKEKGYLHLEISDAAMEKMIGYDWPGNVRELQNALERAVVMGRGRKIEPEDLPMFASRGPSAEGIDVGMTLEEAMHAFKKKFIRMNLKKTGGNQTRAAKIMGIQRTYLSRLISRYGIKKDRKHR